jgi:hypothetical protein
MNISTSSETEERLDEHDVRIDDAAEGERTCRREPPAEDEIRRTCVDVGVRRLKGGAVGEAPARVTRERLEPVDDWDPVLWCFDRLGVGPPPKLCADAGRLGDAPSSLSVADARLLTLLRLATATPVDVPTDATEDRLEWWLDRRCDMAGRLSGDVGPRVASEPERAYDPLGGRALTLLAFGDAPPAGKARAEGGRLRLRRSSLNQRRKVEKRLPRERGLVSEDESLGPRAIEAEGE